MYPFKEKNYQGNADVEIQQGFVFYKRSNSLLIPGLYHTISVEYIYAVFRSGTMFYVVYSCVRFITLFKN